MSEVTTPIEQDGYNAYGYVDGKRVPVLSTAMGNCWDQDDQRAFCGHIVHCVNNMPKVVEALSEVLEHLPPTDGWTCKDMAIDHARELLATLEAEKGGEL